MATRIFLAVVGLLYVALGVWCATAPATTSKTVGLTLDSGSARSEFLTVFGGLEIGMGIVFLLPLFRNDWLPFALSSCLIMHLCLVIFRSVGFATIEGIQRSTVNLAIGEWIILLGTVLFLWLELRSNPGSS